MLLWYHLRMLLILQLRVFFTFPYCGNFTWACEGRLAGIIMNLLDLFFTYGLTRILKMKATIYTNLRSCLTAVKGGESQGKYRYLFVLLWVKSDWATSEINIPYFFFFLCQDSLALLLCKVSAELGWFTYYWQVSFCLIKSCI